MRLGRFGRRIWKPLALIAGLYGVCTTGFFLTQHVTPFNAVYWGIITMSTVGYGDVVPTNTLSKVFAMVLAGSTIGVLGYVISTLNTLAIQARDEELLGMDGTELKGHVVLLGWTVVSRAALQELLLAGRKVAVMTRHQERLSEVRSFATHLIREARKDPDLKALVSSERDLFVCLGDYSERGALDLVNLAEAKEAIVASDDDARNVMTALILKELAPHLRIVVAVLREELRETLHAAGVTYVISPSDLGGRMVSAAAVQPEVAKALDELSTSSEGSSLEEYPLVAPNPLIGLTFEAAGTKLRESTGAILTGLARPRAGAPGYQAFQVLMPPAVGEVLQTGSYVLVLSQVHDVPRVRKWLRVPPGRPPQRDRAPAPH